MTRIISGIPVRITKKDIKNMRLYVTPPDGKVTVSAPFAMRDEAIEKFVLSKIEWIRLQIEKCEKLEREANPQYEDGETFFVWGNPHIVKTEFGGRYNINIEGNIAHFTVRKTSTPAQREKYAREWYREILKTEIANRLPVWEKKTGLKPESFTVKYMTSRWGSCKIKKRNICLNLQLAKKRIECLDYIILHELLHFRERGHNERFYGLMQKYMPKWKEVKKILNNRETGIP